MRAFNASAALLLCIIAAMPVHAGDPPAVHLTGNPAVDFFGNRQLAVSFSPARPIGIFQAETLPPEESGEKSPWLAGLMSLVVPGSGEVYAKSYVKGALFFAAEVASWAVVYSYNKKGNDQTDFYKAYADAHYSPVRYAEWLRNYMGANGRDTAGFDSRIFNGTPQPNSGPPFASLNWSHLNALEADLGQSTSGGFSHQLPYYGEQQYYELIGKYVQFMRGWDTEDPTDPVLPDVSARYLAAHQQFFNYGEWFNQADTYYNIASSFLDVVVVNHILSALDAIWSASRYNKVLHAEMHMDLQPTPYGPVPVTHASLQYNF